MAGSAHSNRDKAIHALKRGAIVFGALVVISVSLRLGLLEGVPSTSTFVQTAEIAAVGGLMTFIVWYRKLTKGSLL